MKKIFFVLILVLFLFPISLFCQPCGERLDCSPEWQYPYTFCNTKTDSLKNYCTNNPSQYEKDNPHLIVRRAKLPIYVALGKGADERLRYSNKYKTGSEDEGITLLGDAPTHEGGYNDANKVLDREMILASNKWNCVCGYEVATPADAETVVYAEISHDNNRFKHPLNPRTTLALAKDPTDNSGETGCDLKVDSATIYFNFSPLFLYDEKDFPINADGTPNYDTPIKRGWIAQEYLDNVKLVPDSVKLYSFLQTAMHEIGHLLGFNHTDKAGSSYCEGSGKFGANGIMKTYHYDVQSGENITDLSSYDKCMMATLYCPGLTNDIKEIAYQPNIVVSPNPAKKEVNINFEIKAGVKPVSIEICSASGQIVATLFSDVMYSEGTHVYNAKLNYAAGVYFILTKIDNITYSNQLIVE